MEIMNVALKNSSVGLVREIVIMMINVCQVSSVGLQLIIARCSIQLGFLNLTAATNVSALLSTSNFHY